MGRPPKEGIPASVTCEHCGEMITLKKHKRSKWLKGQHKFFCSNQRIISYRSNRKPNNAKHSINEEYFQSISSEDAAYWLGYISSDGNISLNNGYKFSVGSIDRDQIENLKTTLEYTGSLATRRLNNKDFYVLNTSNKNFVNNLINKGVVPKKTFKLAYPWFINKHLIRHYLRGYLDGDGSISYNPVSKMLQCGFVGTYGLMKNVAEFLYEEGIIKSSGIYKSENIFRFARSQIQAEKFLEYLYTGASVYMECKYNKFLEYKGDTYAVYNR